MSLSDEMKIDEVIETLQRDTASQRMGNSTYSPVHMDAALILLNEYSTLQKAVKEWVDAIDRFKDSPTADSLRDLYETEHTLIEMNWKQRAE